MSQHTWGWEMDPRLEPGVTCPGRSICAILEHKGYRTCQHAGQCQDPPDTDEEDDDEPA
jgi:hypothetical protein